MINPLKAIRNYIRDRRQSWHMHQETLAATQSLGQIAIACETLNQYRRMGLLHVDHAKHIISISSLLSEYFVYDPFKWQIFLKGLMRWAQMEYATNAYSDMFTKYLADAEAVAFADRQEPPTDDERRIVRMEAAERFDSDHNEVEFGEYKVCVVSAATHKPIVVAYQNNDGIVISKPVKN